MSNVRRRLSIAIGAAGGVAPTALGATWWSRLPDPVAIHWGASGAPDGAGPRWLLVVLPVVVVAVTSGVAALAGRGDSRPAEKIDVTATVGVLAFGIGCTTLLANLDAPIWQDAANLTLPLFLLVLAPAFGIGWLLRRRPSSSR